MEADITRGTTSVSVSTNRLGTGHAIRQRAARQMRAVLARLGVRPVRAEVVFSDENGPKGGRDIRCAVTVRLPYRPALHVEHLAETPRLAFDAAFGALDRRLQQYRERQRERRRRPKKYYVAKRLLTGQ